MCMMQSYAAMEKGKRKLTEEETMFFMAHFSKVISKEIEDYVIDELMVKSRYLFLTREKKQQYAYCTHCKQSTAVQGVKHKIEYICPNCESECITIKAGLGRSNMVDHAKFTFYEKSVLNPKALVARSIHVVRDYRGDYKDVLNIHSVDAWYVFMHGEKPVMVTSDYYGNAIKTASVYSYYGKNGGGYIASRCPEDKFLNAIKDTPFQYSCWDRIIWRNNGRYNFDDDLIDYMALYCERPQVELFIKAGLTELVKKKTVGESLKRTVNWNGKTLEKALGLTRQEFKELKSVQSEISVNVLHFLKMNKKNKWNLSIKQAAVIAAKLSEYRLEEFAEMAKVDSPLRLYNYFEKQEELSKKHYKSIDMVISDYRDYLRDCEKLNYDLGKESMRFPKNLKKAHEETIKRIQYVANEHLKADFAKRAKELKKYEYQKGNLFIRPVASPGELVDEGAKLSHCVGSYAKSHASGNTSIMLVRRIKTPNKPYYTVELIGGAIRQIRGFENDPPTDDVENFMDEYKKNVLGKLKEKSKRRDKEALQCQI